MNMIRHDNKVTAPQSVLPLVGPGSDRDLFGSDGVIKMMEGVGNRISTFFLSQPASTMALVELGEQLPCLSSFKLNALGIGYGGIAPSPFHLRQFR